MNNQTKNFKEIIDFINNNELLEIKELSSYVKSDNFNNALKAMEININKSYDSIRMLEDLLSFTKEIIEERMTNTNKLCDSLLKNIKVDSLGTYKQTYNIPIIYNNELTTDRNSVIISNCEIYDNKIYPGIEKDTAVDIEHVVKYQSIYNNKREIIEELSNNNIYRTTYNFTERPTHKIYEDFEIKLKNISDINYLDIQIANCEIDYIQLIDIDGEAINVASKFFPKAKSIEKINIRISCNNFKRSNRIFYYIFGIDSITIKNSSTYTNSCFLSNEIELANDNFIELDTIDNQFNGSIEYYIIEDNIEYPIIPNNNNYISNEKLFHDLNVRFNIAEKPTIYKNQIEIDTDLDSIIDMESNDYTLSYKCNGVYTYKPNKRFIKVKAIIRTYNKDNAVPYIENINIKQYGGM